MLEAYCFELLKTRERLHSFDDASVASFMSTKEFILGFRKHCCVT